MRRWLVVIMLLVLPLRFAWAAAAPYCAHEAAGATSKHPGHHQHVHQGGNETTETGDGAAGSGSGHPDCASCHPAAAATLPLVAVELTRGPGDGVGEPPPSRYRSHTPAGPDLPDIVELNPVARFGGEVEFRPLPG